MTPEETAERSIEGTTKRLIEDLRRRLLDLGSRNKLISFSHSQRARTHIRLYELPNILHGKLAEGKRLSFICLPEWPQPYYYEAMPSINSGDQPRHTDNEIHTSLAPEVMETKLSGIRDQARTALQETGVNTLYCVFGFLRWYENDSSDIARLAPLLLHPIEIDRQLKNTKYKYSITSLGEETQINLSLSERLTQDFGIRLPDLEESDKPEDYFSKVTEAIKDKNRWRVCRFVTMGLFAFARFVMYRDLDPSHWPDEKAFARHPVLTDILNGVEVREDATYAPEYDVDIPEIVRQVPLLITEADSSQFSAIVDVMAGKNLVIEGPPGTGKSQTITNVIAAALAQGKRVLFMAEKMAALEVVKNRLDKAGLGHFCLELHSIKACKKGILAALKDRLELQGRLPEPVQLDAMRHEMTKLKRALKDYVDILNVPFGRQGRTIQQLLWAEQRTRQFIETLPTAVESVYIADVKELDRFTIAQLKDRLSAVESLAQHFTADFGSPEHHPWRGITRGDLTVYDREELIETMTGWGEILEALRRILADQAAEFNIAPLETLTAADTLRIHFERVPNAVSAIDGKLFAKLVDARAIESLTHLMDDRAAYYDLLPEKQPASDLDRLLAERSRVEMITIRALEAGSADRPISELPAHIREAREELAHWMRMADYTQRLRTAFGVAGNSTPDTLLSLASAAYLLRNTDRRTLLLRSPALVDELNRELLTEAGRTAAKLRSQGERLAAEFDLSAVESPAALRAHARALKEAGSFAFLSGSVRSAKRAYRLLARSITKVPPQTMMTDFERLADHLEATKQFADDPRLCSICGASFNGIHTDFAALEAVSAFAIRVRQEFPSTNQTRIAVRRVCLEADIDTIDVIIALTSEPAFEDYVQMRTALLNSQDTDFIILVDQLESKLVILKELHSEAHALGIADHVQPFELPQVLDTAEQLRQARTALEANQDARIILGSHFTGLDTDLEPICRLLDFVRTVEEARLPEGIRQKIYVENYSAALAELKRCHQRICAALDRASLARATVEQMAGFDLDRFLDGKAYSEKPLKELTDRINDCLANKDALPAWSDYILALNNAEAGGLGDLLQAFRREGRPFERLVDAFDRAFYRTLVRQIFNEYPALRSLNGLSQQQARERFQELDHELLELESKKLAAQLAQKVVEPGIGTGPRNPWTDLALIRYQLSLQRRHLSLRNLLGRAGTAIQQLKPCFMMSPLSVAQFLKAGELDFDLIVIDEASQLRPEDAIGGIIRSKQIVVVGDPKQLPPTNFFNRMEQLPEENEEEEYIDTESILDLALNTFHPARRLRWHYRSRHGSLIAFSNQHFYNNDLIVFPSPYESHNDFGVRRVRVQEGRYHNRTNVPEALKVASDAVSFMGCYSKRSLGIVAMNQAQRELILAEIDRLVATNSEAADYIAQWETSLEPFFVKNLESIQGDERDVIMISTVYGPNESGRVLQRFGPINSDVGWRRLNVLFTRAKEQVVAYSSMDANDILVNETSKRGVKALHDYLEFAATGRLETGEITSREPDSDFEIFVAERLRDHGYEVVPQVGVAGYFIDLAVRHPHQRNGFLLGIECDGATYHSAKSARDRDRLREEVLRNLGWKLYRIWSTDWFSDPRREVRKLIAHIEKLADGY